VSSGRYVYWLSRDFQGPPGVFHGCMLRRVSLDAGLPQSIGSCGDLGAALAAVGNDLYWLDHASSWQVKRLRSADLDRDLGLPPPEGAWNVPDLGELVATQSDSGVLIAAGRQVVWTAGDAVFVLPP
jgi:hypothetical protein